MVDTVFKDTADVVWKNTADVTWEKGGYTLAADGGSIGVTGTDASFLRSLVVPLAGGTYTITGSDVQFINSEGYALALDPGTFNVVGSDIGLNFDRALSLDPGALKITGSDVALLMDRKASLEAGAIALTGTDADLKFNRVLSLGSGDFGITGTDLAFSVETASIAGNLVYIFTLTGDADGTTDIEIPISSFQARLRSGSPTYLQVVIPGMDYASQITARSNGDLKVDAAYLVGGEYTARETIITVNLEDIRTDKGTINQSITLTGHKQTTYTNKTITLTGATYKNTINGAIRYRFAEPNLHLFPGDTAIVGTDTFEANVISYFVGASTGGIKTTMEIAES